MNARSTAIWPLRMIREITSYAKRGKSPVYSETDEGTWVINQECITYQGIDFSKVKYHSTALSQPHLFFLRDGDVLLNSTGTGTIGRVALFRGAHKLCVADSHVTVLRVDEELICSKFLCDYLSSSYGQRHLEAFCYSGSTNQIELSRNFLLKTLVPCPELIEQSSISTVLQSIEVATKKARKSITYADRLQNGLSQQLLTGRIKADGTLRRENEFWIDSKLGFVPKGWTVEKGWKIAEKITKGQSPKWQGFDYTTSGMLFVTSENVRDGFLDLTAPKFLPLGFNEKIKGSELQPGDLLINLVGASIGRSCVFSSDYKPANINQAVCLFRPKSGIASRYLGYYLRLPSTVNRLLSSQVETARANLSLGDVRRLKFVIPEDEDEQNAITEKLDKIGSLIETKKTKIFALQRLKKSLMQNLLTGRIRLPIK